MQRIEREKKNAKRYRGIRFIEGQKLTRKLKQLQKSLETANAKVGPRVLVSLRRPPSHQQRLVDTNTTTLLCVHGLSRAPNSQEGEGIEKEIEKVSRDLLYIKHYPNSEKYISILLPATDENAANIERIRTSIEKKLMEKAIVTEADEGLGLQQSAGVAHADPADDMAEEDDFFLGEGGESLPENPPSIPSSAGEGGPELGETSTSSSDGDDDAGDGAGEDRGMKIHKKKPPVVAAAIAPRKKREAGQGASAEQKKETEKQPTRTRAEGGRKRRRKKK